MLDLSRIGWNTNRQWSLRQAEGLDFEDMNTFHCHLCMKIEIPRAIIGSHPHRSFAVSKHGQLQI